MTLGEIIFQFPNNIKIIIRQLEKLERKHIKANMAILFNRTCVYIYMMYNRLCTKRSHNLLSLLIN